MLCSFLEVIIAISNAAAVQPSVPSSALLVSLLAVARASIFLSRLLSPVFSCGLCIPCRRMPALLPQPSPTAAWLPPREQDTEVWKPESSSLLQVLVSIQGLILVEKPYFNEAGYETQAGSEEGERNAQVYNEQALLECLKTMVNVLRNPPRHFEPLVQEHFSRRAQRILERCEEYLQGRPVGPPPRGAGGGGGEGSSASSAAAATVGLPAAAGPQRIQRAWEASNSEGFRLLLGKLVPKLRVSLARLGCTGA